MSESDISRSICDYLTMRKHWVIRLNNVPPTFFDKSGGRQFRRLPKYAIHGLPDLLVFVTNREGVTETVFLEVKAPKGKQSPDQKTFQKLCEDRGIEYHVVREIRDCQELGL